MLSHFVRGLEEHDKGCKCQLRLMEFRIADFYYHLHWNMTNMNKWTALTTVAHRHASKLRQRRFQAEGIRSL